MSYCIRYAHYGVLGFATAPHASMTFNSVDNLLLPLAARASFTGTQFKEETPGERWRPAGHQTASPNKRQSFSVLPRFSLFLCTWMPSL